MEANFRREIWGPLKAKPWQWPRGSKLSEKNHFSRVVDTLETSLEHVVSLMYSADRSPRYIIYHFE